MATSGQARLPRCAGTRQYLLPLPTAPGDAPRPREPTPVDTTAGGAWDWWLFAWHWPEPRDRQ